jgi:thioredoxin 2
MENKSVLLRCAHCGAVNRVPEGRLPDRPKCGKCGDFLEFYRTPVDVTSSTFEKEVLSWPGGVLVEFWAPW